MASTSGNSNVFRIPRRFNWPLVVGGFALLTLCMMLGRWRAMAADSQAWLDTARWLRGGLPPAGLQPPFSWGLGLPALAALMPGELHHAFATLNWLFVTATALLATATVRRLGFGTQRALAAGLLVILSLPTVWYAPAVLADPATICLRMLFVCAVLTGRPGVALAAALAATAVREQDILLLAWLAVNAQAGKARIVTALAAAAAWIAGLHLWLAPAWVESGAAPWRAEGANLQALLTGWPGMLSLAACAGFVLPLAAAGLRDAPERLRPLRSLLALMLVPAAYAALCTGADGRIVWNLYPFLLPYAVALGLPRTAAQVPAVRQLRAARRA